MSVEVDVVPFAKCARCRKCLVEVGRIYDWPDLCWRCVHAMEALAEDSEDPAAFSVYWQAHFARHPLRMLASNPDVPRLERDGRLLEVWPRDEEEGWWIVPTKQVPVCSDVRCHAPDGS